LRIKDGNKIMIIKYSLLQVLIFILIVPVSSQNNFPLGSKPAALANAFVMESDLWSVFHNQAGLGSYKKFAAGFHHENKFLVQEYSLHALAITIPVNPGTIGVSYSYFGYTKYHESKIGLGFGKTFGKKFSAGVQLNYHYLFISGDSDNRNSLSVEGGLQYRPIEEIAFGIHLFNPTMASLSSYDQDTIPTTLRTGISIKPFRQLWLAVETEKSLDTELRFKTGIEYMAVESLYLRTGIVTSPFQSTFGLGYEIPWARVDIAFTMHEVLGLTPHFTFQFAFR
jgi:hypothetical protein